MELFGQLLTMVLDLLQVEFTIFGFTFSFWQVFVFDIVAGIVAWILSEVFLGD